MSGYYFGAWYHAEVPLLAAVGIGLGLAVWPHSLTMLVTVCLCIPILQVAWQAPRQVLQPIRPDPYDLQYVIAETAQHLNSLPGIHQMRIAAWNAGLLGFLVETTVINLDGFANEDIERFRSAGGSIGAYLQRERVQLLVDARSKRAPLRLDHLQFSILHATPWLGADDYEPGWFVMQLRQE